MRAHVSVAIASLAAAVTLGAFGMNPPTVEAAQLPCSPKFTIDHTFANGARWQMCWEPRYHEGIVFRRIYYTPPGGGPERLVLYDASLAELYAPYDDTSVSFHDLSDYGLGDQRFLELVPAECPGGTLHDDGLNPSKKIFCQHVRERGHAYRFFDSQLQGEELRLFSMSQVGMYVYSPTWLFHDDGAIGLSLGASGKLQKYTSQAAHGWEVRPGVFQPYGTSHNHLAYWRLDFDLQGFPNDRVEEINFAGAGSDIRTIGTQILGTEVARLGDPAAQRFWRVLDPSIPNTDAHPISYDVIPETSQLYRGAPYEKWTEFDFHLTQYNPCERFATHNNQVPGCNVPGDVIDFASNGQTVSDVVVWPSVNFHHVTRDEDEDKMHTHWQGMWLVPRDWTAKSPLP